MPGKELPLEVVADIQRIFELDSESSHGPDALSGFNPVETLNSLFPNGLCDLNISELMLNDPFWMTGRGSPRKSRRDSTGSGSATS